MSAITKAALEDLSTERLEEAKILLQNQHYDGAYYLAGYALEMALKARICTNLDRNDYPENENFKQAFKTHHLDDLLKLSGLYEELNRAKTSSQTLSTYWSLVTDWNESFRYKPVGTQSQQYVQKFITALEDPQHGILTWIRQRW
jgi:hypothetical protein